jgi:hypothetical protein
MNLKDINLNFKDAIENGTDTHGKLYPYDVATFLEICHKTLQHYIRHANSQIDDDASHITSAELEKINSVFKELYENFFPMAHTNSPLSELHIINTEKAKRMKYLYEHISRCIDDFRQIDEQISEILPKIVNP